MSATEGDGAPKAASTAPSALPWVVQLLSSTFLMYELGLRDVDWFIVDGDGDLPSYVYSSIAGSVGLALSLVGLVLLKCFYTVAFAKELFPMANVGVTSFRPCTVGSLLAAITLVWWTIATGILTFHGPYAALKNGWIASWGGFLGALYSVGFKHSDVTGRSMLEPLFFLFVGSVVVVFATVSTFPQTFTGVETESAAIPYLYVGNAIYGLIVAVLSILVASTWFILDIVKPAALEGNEQTVQTVRAVGFVVLAVMWILATVMLTFSGPFDNTASANGYVGVWASLVAALFCAAADTTPFQPAVVVIGGAFDTSTTEASTEATPLKGDGAAKASSTVLSSLPWVVQYVSSIVLLFEDLFRALAWVSQIPSDPGNFHFDLESWSSGEANYPGPEVDGPGRQLGELPMQVGYQTPNYKYATVVGSVALVLSMMGLVLMKFFYRSAFAKELFPMPNVGAVSFMPCTVGSLLAAITLVWWTIATGIMTFHGPYVSLSNGYLATWGGFLGALYSVGFKHSDETGRFMLEPLFFLFVASIIVFFATMSTFVQAGSVQIPTPQYTNTRIYGLVASLLSMSVTSTWFILDIAKPAALEGKEQTVQTVRAVGFGVLVIVWIVAANLLLEGPFETAFRANGYFGSLASLVAALFCAAADTTPFQAGIVAMYDAARRYKPETAPLGLETQCLTAGFLSCTCVDQHSSACVDKCLC